MARLIPDDLTPFGFAASGHASELRTLARLSEGLGDDFTIWHSVHWAQVHHGASAFGEIDFIVCHRTGWLLAIEQKEVPVEVLGDDLIAHYRGPGPAGGTHDKSVTTQVNRSLNALRSEFARRHAGRRLDIDHLFFLPNAQLTGPLPAALAPERVVDASRADALVDVILGLFDAGAAPSGADAATALEIEAFLSQKVQAAPHVGLLGRSAREFSTRLSGGLATWASRLAMSPWRLRVKGTAGSGKTQLALRELKSAHERGEPALYVCYNRPLADAMRQAAPDPSAVVTFH